jgi:hypothetical protein
MSTGVIESNVHGILQRELLAAPCSADNNYRAPGVRARAASKTRRKFSPMIFATSTSPRPRASSAAGIRLQSR